MITEKIDELKRLDPKFYRQITVFLISAAAFSALLLILFVRDIQVSRELGKAIDALVAYEGRAMQQNVPSEERLVFLTEQLNRLKAIDEKLPREILYEDLSARNESSPADPVLQFKEKLFAMTQQLRKQSLPDQKRFPKKYGLEEYETRLPQARELPELSLRLQIAEALISQLLRDPDAIVEELSFTETVEGKFSDAMPEAYRDYYLRLSFYGRAETLVAFLEYLLRAEYLYQVPSIAITPSDRKDAPIAELKVVVHLGVFKIQEGPRA